MDLFRGVLVLFILEMGMAAARQLRRFGRVAGRMLAGVPLVHMFARTWAGL